MASKQVFVRRRPNYTKLPDDLYYEANRKIGSSFARGTRDVLRGLTPEEEEKYLPEILGVGPNEPTFRQAKKDFWCEISLIIESGEGTPLEIGLDKNSEPINLNDWILWKFAKKHADVALSEELVRDSQCKYYIYDPEAQRAVNTGNFQKLKAARKLFMAMSDDDAKMRQVLRLMGYDTRLLSPDANAAEEELGKFVEKMPEQFAEVATDDNLSHKSFLEECVSAGVIDKLGNLYMDGDNVLGNSLKEAVAYVKDPVHSKVITVLKARLEQSA